MSQQARQPADVRAEWAVRKRSQYVATLHRPDPDAEGPRPACQQAQVDYPDDYRRVRVSTHPTYDLCDNPECFGEGSRGGRHMWRGSLADRPLRIQAYHVAVVVATHGETPITRSDVHGLLAVESAERSLQRGLRDARAAGWLEWDESSREYRQGPLAAAIAGGDGS